MQFKLTGQSQELDTVPVAYRKPLFNFDPSKSPFKFTHEQLKNDHGFLRFSILTGYREGVEPIQGFVNFQAYDDEKSGTRKLSMYNLSIQDMLTHGFYKDNKVILEVKNPAKYRYDKSQGAKYEWLRENGYCFEFSLPSGAINGVEILNKELARVFGVEFGLKKRIVNALVLIRISNIDKIKSLGKGEGHYDMLGKFNNVPIDRLNHPLHDAGLPPMVDETGYKDPVDLDLHIKSWTDLPLLRKELQRYDLDLREEKREIEMFVITEIN